MNLQFRNIESFKFKQLLFFVFSAFYILYIIFELHSLLSGTYIISQQQLFPLDTIVLQNKAYYRGGGGKSSSISYDFQDTSGQWFRIDDTEYHAITDKPHIIDTLRYHGTKLFISTDQKGVETYRNKHKKEYINVLQLSLGNNDYIDLVNLNRENRERKVGGLLVISGFYLLALLFYFKAKRNEELLTNSI